MKSNGTPTAVISTISSIAPIDESSRVGIATLWHVFCACRWASRELTHIAESACSPGPLGVKFNSDLLRLQGLISDRDPPACEVQGSRSNQQSPQS